MDSVEYLDMLMAGLPADERPDGHLLSPHLGTDTHGTGLKVAMTAARNLVAGLKGEPLPLCVNPEVNER